jgi:hypothetical protein
MPNQALGFDPTQRTSTFFGSLGLAVHPEDWEIDYELNGRVAEALLEGSCDVESAGSIAATCMDDRLRPPGQDPFRPNVGGGGFGLLYAARAVTPAYDRDTLTAANFMNLLASNDLPVYAHIDEDYERGVATGCAFNDKIALCGSTLSQVYEETLQYFGYDKSEDTMTRVSELAERVKAVTRVNDDNHCDAFGEDPKARLDAVKDAGGVIGFYGGPHLGIGADISFREGYTLSRDTLFNDLGAHMFHVDAWSYRPTAEALVSILPRSEAQREGGTTDDDIIWQMVTGMFLNSFAALAALNPPSSLLVIRA